VTLHTPAVSTGTSGRGSRVTRGLTSAFTSGRPWVGLGLLAVLVGAQVPAAAAEVRPVVSSHVSFTHFGASVPAGAVVSVLQRCPSGSSLDRTATRAVAPRNDAELQSTVRLLSRELWPTGMVSRYRVVQAAEVPRDDGFGLVNTAVCTGTRAVQATSFTGRASTEVRLWGPVPAGARLRSFTLAAVSDGPISPDSGAGADLPYRTAVQALGVSASPGALAGGIRGSQAVHDDDGSGSVGATGSTRRAVPSGRFVSMRSSYAFTADLTRRITVTDALPSVFLESRPGQCSAQPTEIGAGRYDVGFVTFDGPASVVVREPGGAVVLEQVAVRLELPVGEREGQPYGVAEPAVLTLTEGDYTVECRPDGAPATTAVLRVTGGPTAAEAG